MIYLSDGGSASEKLERDPVGGMMVDEKRAQFHSEHEGRIFYFCSAGCKQTFERDSHRYGHPD